MASFIGYKGDRTQSVQALGFARALGASPAACYLPMAGTSSPATRLVQLMRLMVDSEQPRLSPGGYAFFSYLTAQTETVKNSFGGIPEPAITAGMLTARWRVAASNEFSSDDLKAYVDRLRPELIMQISRYGSVITTALKNLQSTTLPGYRWGTDPATIPGTDQHMIEQISAETNQARKFLVACEAGGIPWAKFGITMEAIDADNINSLEALAALVPLTIPNNWHDGLTSDHILNLCNFIARNNVDEVKPITMRSLFICTSGIAKGTNITPKWMTARWNNVKDQYPDIAAGRTEVDREMVRDFHKFFIGPNAQIGALYGSLMFSHQISRLLDVQILTWIVEQARGANTTSVGAIARACAQFDAFTYTILARVVPESDFVAAISAMCSSIMQPYATLHRPVMSVSNFPNLAFIALSLAMSSGVEGLIASAKGKLTANEMSVMTLMNTIRSCQQETANTLTGMGVLLSAYKVNAVPNPGNACTAMAYPGLDDPTAVEEQAGVSTFRNLAGLTPSELTAITPQLKPFSMKDIIQHKGVDKDTQFAKVCSAYRSAVLQLEITDLLRVPNAQGLFAPTELPTEARDAMDAFGGTVPTPITIQMPVVTDIGHHYVANFQPAT